MNIFGNIVSAIFKHAAAPKPTPASTNASPTPQKPRPPLTSAGNAPAPPAVDVEAVLSQLADKEGGGGNWRTSIVDLLKLLDLDSGLAARKELASEVGVRVGADGSAEQNIALQKAVMRKLAANGGKVPDSLKD